MRWWGGCMSRRKSGLIPTYSEIGVEPAERMLAAKRANPQADTSPLEREIDELVYQLYGLTEEEIEIVEGK